jgi:CBS domain-containing protein
MKVRELMTSCPATCTADDDLATAALRMWDEDCGVLPVVEDGRIRGVLTDRDICMALAFRGARPPEVRVGDVIQGHAVYTCSPEDDLMAALHLMQDRRVRRLPVIEEDRLIGLLSINDIVVAAHEEAVQEPTAAEILEALQGICEHRSLPAAA